MAFSSTRSNDRANDCAGSAQFRDSKMEGSRICPNEAPLDSFLVYKFKLRTENGDVCDGAPSFAHQREASCGSEHLTTHLSLPSPVAWGLDEYASRPSFSLVYGAVATCSTIVIECRLPSIAFGGGSRTKVSTEAGYH
ncbi:hypothetical protein ACTXT7_009433 [Hymenolepis weldensis]